MLDARYRKAFKEKNTVLNEENESPVRWFEDQQAMKRAGLHKLWYPGIRDMSTWSKFGAHGEHGDVFLFSNLGAL